MNFLFLFPAFLVLVSLFFLPVTYLIWVASEQFSGSIFQDPFLIYVMRFTYVQAVVSATASVCIGFCFAFLIKEWSIRGGRFLWRFGLLCSSLPSIIIALGILGAWSRYSIIFGWKGILLGHVFLNTAIPLRLIGNALEERERTSELTAQSLGFPLWRVFFSITMPAIRGSIFSSWLLSFLYSSTSFFIVLFLGGGPRFTTLEVALYEAIKLNLDSSRAIQIALLQAFVGVVLFFFYLRVQRKTRLEGSRADVKIYNPRRGPIRAIGGLVLWTVAILLFGYPLLSIVFDGVVDLAFLDWGELLDAATTTFLIATAVVLLSVSLLYPFLHCIYQRKAVGETSHWIWLVAFPQFFSALVISLSISVFFPSIREIPWLSYVAIVCTQTLFVIPLIQFPLREGFLRLSKERNWLAQSLGANPWQRWLLVELPFMRRSVFLAALMGFGFSMGEVVSVLLFSPPGIKTLALNIFQAMSRYRFQEARATTVVLLSAMIFLFGIVGYLEDRDESSGH